MNKQHGCLILRKNSQPLGNNFKNFAEKLTWVKYL